MTHQATLDGKLENIHNELSKVESSSVENARDVLKHWHLKLLEYEGYGGNNKRVVAGYGAPIGHGGTHDVARGQRQRWTDQ